jgi:hypothetical protein
MVSTFFVQTNGEVAFSDDRSYLCPPETLTIRFLVFLVEFNWYLR